MAHLKLAADIRRKQYDDFVVNQLQNYVTKAFWEIERLTVKFECTLRQHIGIKIYTWRSAELESLKFSKATSQQWLRN